MTFIELIKQTSGIILGMTIYSVIEKIVLKIKKYRQGKK